MKRRLITIAGVVVIMAGLVGFNYLRPDRLTASTLAKAEEVQKKLAQEPLISQPDQSAQEMNVAQSETQSEGPAEKAQAAEKPDLPKQAPDIFKVKFDCSNGAFVIECRKDWAPNGVQRFWELVNMGYYKDNRFFRVVTKPQPFVVQWGIPGDPELAKKWWNKTFPDDPVKQSNTPGMLTFAAGGAPNSRTTQLFINLKDNKFLDGMRFAPIGKVVEGMEIVKKLNDKYQDRPTSAQMQIVNNGNEWLDKQFPGLDHIRSATVIE